MNGILYAFCLLAVARALPVSPHGDGRGELTPRDTSLFRGASLRAYTNRWALTYTTGEGRTVKAGVVEDKLEFLSVNSRSIGRRTQRQVLADGREGALTINDFDAITMEPVRREFRALDGRKSKVEFNGRRVRSEFSSGPNATPVQGDTILPASAYDFLGGLYGLLLAALPLEDGYTTHFLSVGESSDSTFAIPVVVRGREQVQAGPTSVSAWRVEVTTASFGLMTFWLTREPPYIIRLTLTFKGGFASYDMIDAPGSVQ